MSSAVSGLVRQYLKLGRTAYDAGQSVYQRAKHQSQAALKSIHQAGLSALATSKATLGRAKEASQSALEATRSALGNVSEQYPILKQASNAIQSGNINIKYLVNGDKGKALEKAKMKIDELARRGLETANNRSVPIEPCPEMPPETKAQIQALESTKFEAAVVVQPHPRDWPAERERLEKKIDRLSISASTLYLMREFSGIVNTTLAKHKSDIDRLSLQLRGNESDRPIKAQIAAIEKRIQAEIENENLELMSMSNQTARDENAPSVWTVFTQRYNLSLWQKIKAGLFYWIVYKTSIAASINKSYGLNAYLRKSIPFLKDSKNLSKIFAYLLAKTNQWVEGDIKAHRDYAEGTIGKDLKTLREELIVGDIKTQCEEFFQKQTTQELPEIHLFPSKWLKWLNWPINKLKNWFNKHFILPMMRDEVLPKLANKVIGNSLEATGANELAFSRVYIGFMIRQMTKVQKELEKELVDLKKGIVNESSAPEALPGTEMMPVVIPRFMDLLKLQSDESSKPGAADHLLPTQLKQIFQDKIDKIQHPIYNLIDNKTKQAIEGGVIQAGHGLFNYLNQTAQSEELVANILELTIQPFTQERRDPKIEKSEYEKDIIAFERLADDVVEKMVVLQTEKLAHWNPNDHAKEKTESTYRAWSMVAGFSATEIDRVCTEMVDHINQVKEADDLYSLNEWDIQPQIASFFQMMNDLANKREGSQEIDNLKESHRDVVQRTTLPFYNQAIQIEEQVLELQEVHQNYAQIAAAHIKLQLARDQFSNFRKGIMEHPRHFDGQLNEFVSDLQSPFEEISKRERANTDAPQQALVQNRMNREVLEQHSLRIRTLSENLGRDQSVLDALRAIWSPEGSPQAGYLQQLYSYYVAPPYPRGYKPSTSIEGIRLLLRFFTPEEQARIADIRTGAGLSAQWNDLKIFFDEMYQKYSTQQTENQNQMNAELDGLERWITDRTFEAHKYRYNEYNVVRAKVDRISHDVKSWNNNMKKPESFSVPRTVTPTEFKSSLAVGAGLTAAISEIVGPSLSWIATKTLEEGMISNAVSTTLGLASPLLRMSFAAVSTASLALEKPKLAAVGAAASAILATAIPAPYAQIGTIATSSFAAWRYEKAFQAFGTHFIVPVIRENIRKAKKYLRNPLLYKAAAVHTLDALS